MRPGCGRFCTEPATAQARTAQEVEHLELLCLQRRQLHRLADIANIDPSYYLG